MQDHPDEEAAAADDEPQRETTPEGRLHAAELAAIAQFDPSYFKRRFLRFAPTVAAELKNAYASATPAPYRAQHRANLGPGEVPGPPVGGLLNPAHFIRLLEAVAERLSLSLVAPDQETRRRQVTQLAGAVLRLQEAVLQLDSAAFVHVLDSLNADLLGQEDQEQLRPLLFAAAGVMRHRAADLSSVQISIQRASATLPVIDRQEFAPLLIAARSVRHLLDDASLLFECKEQGFAAHCMRSAVELSGATLDRPGYWLAKVAKERANKNGP